MSERPERIEREMFEIRTRMSPDMTDLRKRIDPQVVTEQVKRTVRQRIQDAVERVKANLRAKQQEIVDSAKSQADLARKAGKNGLTEPLTEAVRSDPRPLVLFSVLLVMTLFMARKITGGRG